MREDGQPGQAGVGTAGATTTNPNAGEPRLPPPGQPSVLPGYNEVSRTTTQTGDSAAFNVNLKLSVPGVVELNVGGTFTFPGDTHSVTYTPDAGTSSSGGGDSGTRGGSQPLNQCEAP